MISKSDLAKPLESLNSLEQQKVKMYKRGEQEEELAAIGQESDTKAAPWMREYSDREEAKANKQAHIAMEMLQGLLFDRKAYTRFLARIFMMFSKEEDIPKKYHIELDLSDGGVIVNIKKTKYYGAFRPCGMPLYDYHACKLLAVKLGNTIARLEGYHRVTEGGVLIPYEDEEKSYGA